MGANPRSRNSLFSLLSDGNKTEVRVYIFKLRDHHVRRRAWAAWVWEPLRSLQLCVLHPQSERFPERCWLIPQQPSTRGTPCHQPWTGEGEGSWRLSVWAPERSLAKVKTRHLFWNLRTKERSRSLCISFGKDCKGRLPGGPVVRTISFPMKAGLDPGLGN